PPAARERLQNATPDERQRLMEQLKQRARRGLNENYARELMELHTLGVDGGYTQKDVQEVARALTGWTFQRQTGEFFFNPNIHDAGDKVILGQKFAAGHGEDEGERVLDIVARHPSTARFVTMKLARHFVSDEPPKSLVDRCAQTFTKTDGDIRETVHCVVTSPEFFSRAAYRAKVKTPFELVASALRAVNAEPDTTPRTAEFVALRTQPRPQQVDAVVKSILGGQVSSETRQVLMTGDNPMLSKAANDVNGMTVLNDSTSMGGRG